MQQSIESAVLAWLMTNGIKVSEHQYQTLVNILEDVLRETIATREAEASKALEKSLVALKLANRIKTDARIN